MISSFRIVRHRSGQPRSRAAYTLLELMLALALSVVIVAVITASIAVYMVNLNRQQRFIEQKQVARSVLAMMANDLRAGLQYKAVDVSGIENLSASQDLIAGILGSGLGGDSALGEALGDTDPLAAMEAGGGAAGGGGTGGGSGMSGGGGATDDSGASTSDTESSEEDVAYRPTLIGSSTSINIAISRLPRLDQYLSMLTGGDLSSQTGSDVKSVSYQISSEASPSGNEGFEPEVAQLGGLYRRQIDRAVAAYRGELMAPAAPDEYSQLVAPEIIEVQFRYFDGTDWATSWDSEEMASFPLAIEIILVLDPNRVMNAQSGRQAPTTPQDILELQTYRSVVHLPCAEVPPEDE